MHPRQKQINEMVGGRDPSLVFDGMTPEEHAKSLTESEGDKSELKTPTQVTDAVKKATLKEKMPSIAKACDGTRDQKLASQGFDR